MAGTTPQLPSSRGWASIVCRDRRHYHLEPCRISILPSLCHRWAFVESFSFPQGLQTVPVKTVKYTESTHYVSFQAIANDSVALTPCSMCQWVSVCETSIFFLFFLIQGEEFPSLTNLYFNAITPSSWLSTLQKTSAWWRPPGPLAALIIVVVSL